MFIIIYIYISFISLGTIVSRIFVVKEWYKYHQVPIDYSSPSANAQRPANLSAGWNASRWSRAPMATPWYHWCGIVMSVDAVLKVANWWIMGGWMMVDLSWLVAVTWCWFTRRKWANGCITSCVHGLVGRMFHTCRLPSRGLHQATRKGFRVGYGHSEVLGHSSHSFDGVVFAATRWLWYEVALEVGYGWMVMAGLSSAEFLRQWMFCSQWVV